jgi:two-component system nitrate/nitrite response regulator NarL
LHPGPKIPMPLDVSVADRQHRPSRCLVSVSGGNSKMVRVLLVIDVPFYREGLAALLAQSADVSVVATACGVLAVTEYVVREEPGVVLLDTSAADAHATLESLQRLEEPPSVVALAISETPESIAEWAGAGVLGYVSRTASLEDLLQCLRCAQSGEAYCSPRVMSILLRRFSSIAARARRPSGGENDLTIREREILELVGQGHSNKVIAARLNISHATAKNHVHHILDKLHLSSRAQVAAFLHAQEHDKANIPGRPGGVRTQ